jgi:hypothetical protein
MIFCDKNFGADGLAIVPTGDGRWIVITVAVKSSFMNNSASTNAVDVSSVVENCGTASVCNAYLQRPTRVKPAAVPAKPPVEAPKLAAAMAEPAGRTGKPPVATPRSAVATPKPAAVTARKPSKPAGGGSAGAGTGAGGDCMGLGVGSPGSAAPDGPHSYHKNAIPVRFGCPLDVGGSETVGRLLACGRVAGFLRLQVILPRAGTTKDSAFKSVRASDGGLRGVNQHCGRKCVCGEVVVVVGGGMLRAGLAC